MGMPEFILAVDVEVDPSVESEWNRWYDDDHLPDIVSCSGILEGRRYVTDSDESRRYLTLYRLESPAAVESAEFAARRGWRQFEEHVRAEVRVYVAVGVDS